MNLETLKAETAARESLFTLTANFTAEPVGDILRFWLSRLGFGSPRVEFSAYNQVFQELLAPNSLLASRVAGVNLLLIRLEDWSRDQVQELRAEVTKKSARELVESLGAFAKRATRPTLLVLCPKSAAAADDAVFARTLESAETEVRDAIAGFRGISVITPEEVADLYPVKVVDDPESDRQGHMPFTRAYWAALGTMVARRLCVRFHPPYKVIVVDADNTLWGGVVGEVGAAQVHVRDEWVVLQEFLRAKKRQGMLLALVSKNRQEDVEEVFRREAMVLRRDDFVGWKVNWEPKSRNIASLAGELELGLDSFIFLDDNPVECAEVVARCPAVTTLLLPSDASRIPHFLRHVWAFDLDLVTAVDEKRTELYRQQSERNQFRSTASGFREFIEGLQLRVSLSPPQATDYDRAAQLTQRTNQFNTSGVRRTATELSSLLESGERQALLVRARDRFGDYGEVGLAVFCPEGSTLHVESLLMSCRVLGKGVEHRGLAALGHEAQRLGASELVIPFNPTARNEPARSFLASIGARLGDDGSFRLSSTAAAAVVFDADSVAIQTLSAEPNAEPVDDGSSGPSRPDFLAIAELASVEAVLQAVASHFRRPRPQLSNELVQPRTMREARLAKIWEQILHLDTVGVTDSFLSLGGESVQAASIAARISVEFGVRIPLTAMLSNPTIADLDRHVGGAPRISGTSLPKALERALSPAQQRLWFLDQFIPNRSAYNIPLAWRVKGTLNVSTLEAAFSRVAGRHDLLRSSYGSDEASTGPKVSEGFGVSLKHVLVASEAEALTLANEEASRTFDLTNGPVFRCLAISLRSDDHFLVFAVHHIVSDGWSMGILVRDLNEAYAAETSGREPAWTPLSASYVDYAAWQHTRIAAGDFQDDLAYWKDELRGAPSLLALPSDRPRPSLMPYVGRSIFGQLSSRTREALEALAEREQCTPFTILLTAWQALLHRYGGQEDIVVGVPVAGRTHPDVEELVGCFVNTLPIRTLVDGDRSFLDHVQKVREKVLGALSHQELPFEHLVTELKLERDLSRSPLFQVVLVLQAPPTDLALASAHVTPMALHNGGAKFDLVLEVTPTAVGYDLALEYSTSLFLPETAERMLGHFSRLIDHACASPETSIAALAIMDEAERRQTLAFVNTNAVAFDDVQCLQHWFERRASMSPDSPALSCEGQVLAYADVNRRSNRIAHELIARGVGPDVLVGVCIDRSPDLVIAILAVLKAGGAFLPIDLSYPPERLAFMLADAQAPVLLTEKKLLGALPRHDWHTICLDDPEAVLSERPASNPVTAVTPDHMAYVIYTSGSTGKPKGCMVTHANVARLMLATEQWYGFNERDVWTLFHSSAFDFSVWEIWGALLYGGRLVVVPFLVSRSPEAFYELLDRERVTVLNQTPSAFRQLIKAEESVGYKDLALRYVIFGGEALEMQSLKPWFDRHGDEKPVLVNMYGITETTVHVTYRPLSKNDVRSASMIGVPIPDLQLYILDPRGHPVPVGVPGELHVGGAGLARGYLNRSELTAQRFIPDAVSGLPGRRLYRTGDLARHLPGRDIEYLGRIDDQVKIRGFRIELGEIESVLCEHPAVREAVVMAREDVPGSKRLVAYTVTSQPTPEVSTLREHLKVKLPEYMVPAAFVFLDKLPLTNNGKIDRKSLPAPEQQRPDLAARYVAPRTPAERTLAAIWSKVLRVEQVGVQDNFFELGGDSILTIQVISLARHEGLTFTPKLLFANQTIAELAAVAGTVREVVRASEETLTGDAPLAPIQRWFFEQNREEPHHYNQAFLFDVSEPLEKPLLERALNEVSWHHDGLRLRFVREVGTWRQSYPTGEQATPLRWMDLADLQEAEQQRAIEITAASTQASLDLRDGPLWRAVYIDLGPVRRSRLLLVVHHLVVDGVSWRPLLEDLETAYRQLKAGQTVQLPPKTTSFKAWTEELQKYARTELLQNELPYWRAVTEKGRATERARSDSLSDDALARNIEGSCRTLDVHLTEAETQALIQRVPPVYNTQINDVLLTALTQAWSQWSGSPVLFASLEGHGRENLFDEVDLSRTAGWFTSIFPVSLELPASGGQWEPGSALKAIKEQLRRVPRRGIGYGILRYLSEDGPFADQSEPSIIFNYLGQLDHLVAESKLFRFASESTGAWHSPHQRRRHTVEIDSLVMAGRLHVRWTYSENLHEEVAVRRLADAFLSALKEVVAHCLSPSAGGRTPSDFPLARLDQPALDHLVAGRGGIEDVFPLSPIQTLFYSANPGAVSTVFDQWHCTLDGDLDVAAFQRAWQETLRRHTILRSTIHSDGLPEPVQMVHRDVRAPWTIEDWQAVPVTDQADHWTTFLKTDQGKPLVLSQPPVMRFALCRTAADQWKFLWSVPALLLDGWSWPLVFRDVSRLYELFSQGSRPDGLQVEAVRPYRDYVEWLRRQTSDESVTFWKNDLAGFLTPTALPSEPPEQVQPGDDVRYREYSVRVSADTTEALRVAARNTHMTLNTLVQGAWAMLLSRQSGLPDVVFGTAFSGRPTDLHGAESIVGPFVNNVPVRIHVDPRATAGEFLRVLHARLLELNAHQFIPLMEIQRCSEVPWRDRLFDSVVVFQNYLVDESARRFGGQVDIADFTGPVHTNYPVMMMAEPGLSLRVTLIADRQKVARAAAERWCRDLALILSRLTAVLETPLAELQDLLSSPTIVSPRRRFLADSQNYVPPQTEMEKTIAEVWRKLFGLDRVGIEENFFDLGGHSLLVVQTHSELRESLKMEFSIVALFEHPTIRTLARHLGDPAVPAMAAGEQWRERAARHKQALSQMRAKKGK